MTISNENVREDSSGKQEKYAFLEEHSYTLWLYTFAFMNMIMFSLWLNTLGEQQIFLNSLMILMLMLLFSMAVDTRPEWKSGYVRKENSFKFLISVFAGIGGLGLMNSFTTGVITIAISVIGMIFTYFMLFVGVSEESFFRRTALKVLYLYNDEKRSLKLIMGIIFSSMLFAFMHIWSYGLVTDMLWLPFVLGIMQCFNYIIFKSFLGIVFGHAIYNIVLLGINPLPLLIIIFALFILMRRRGL